ncbi:hypothetical protein ACSNOI_11820 [Actinomadura kijaniata]|uniref:hypothetical protein n=1 Tax=Actinomadura kijaniata TaxID=46161 RepID=UPI003F19383C
MWAWATLALLVAVPLSLAWWWTRRPVPSRGLDAWRRERASDPDDAWLKETYDLGKAARESIRTAVEKGRRVPDERLCAPAAAYARRLRGGPPRGRRATSTKALLGFLLASALFNAVLAVLEEGRRAERLAFAAVSLVVALLLLIDMLLLRPRRLERAERLNAPPPGPGTGTGR